MSRTWGLGWAALQTWDWDRAEAVRKVFVHFEAGHTEVDHTGVGHIVAVRTEVVPLEGPRTEDQVEGSRTGLGRIEAGS